MLTTSRPVTYKVGAANPPSDLRPAIHAECAECGRRRFAVLGMKRACPEAAEELFRKQGWEFDGFKSARCICDECVAKRKAVKARTPRPLVDTPSVAPCATKPKAPYPAIPVALAAAVPVAAAAHAIQSPSLAKWTTPGIAPPTDEEIINASPKDSPAMPPAAVPLAQELSPDARLRIRNMLDNHFDDSAGRYLNGYSDHRIAEECGVPRQAVVGLREIAYGPIKADPVIDALNVEIGSLKAKLASLQKSHDGLGEAIKVAQAAVDVATRKVADLATKIGVK